MRSKYGKGEEGKLPELQLKERLSIFEDSLVSGSTGRKSYKETKVLDDDDDEEEEESKSGILSDVEFEDDDDFNMIQK